MINLFSNTRKKLISEKPSTKRTTNYFKYALGEIVLVVIGILIALQINNWNEQRKIANQEIHLLKSFKTGLIKDLSDIDLNINIHTKGIQSANLLLDVLAGEQPYNDSLALHFSNAMTPTFFENSTSAFETLKSKGIDIISNEKLRNQLINVYDAQYIFFKKNEKYFFEEQNRGLNTVFASRFQESYKYDLESIDYSGELVPLKFEDLKTDQEFLYYFKSIKNRTHVFVNFLYKKLRNDVVNLIFDIDEEIKKKERN